MVACYWKSKEGLRRLCDAHRQRAWDEGRLAGWKAAAKILGESNPRVVYALFEPKKFPMLRAGEPDFVYFDNPYFRRDEKHKRFRLIRNATHLTHLLPEQPGRVIDVPELQPWREEGRRQNIIVIPPSMQQVKIYGEPRWTETAVYHLKKVTQRPITVKHDKGFPLAKLLPNAWAVVTFASVAGVEAAIAGVPVFSTKFCPSWPISAGYWHEIERPVLKDRTAWLRSLAYACWTMDDLEHLDLDHYDYARSDDVFALGAG